MTSNIPRGAIEPSPTDVDPRGAEFIKYCESLKGVRCTISDFITSMDEDNDGTCTTYYENLVANMSQSPSQTESLSDDTLAPTLLLKLEATADTLNSNLTDTQATPGWTAVIDLWMRQGGQPLKDADKTLTLTPGQDNPETLKKTTSPSIERLIYVDSPSFPSTGWKTPAEYIKEVCEGTGNYLEHPGDLFTKVMTKDDFFRLIKLTLDDATGEDHNHTNNKKRKVEAKRREVDAGLTGGERNYMK
jgi:hypothetical protein